MRQYLVVKADKRLDDAYGDFNAMRERTFDILRDLSAPASLLDALKGIEVVGMPSQDFRSSVPDDPAPDAPLSEFMVSYEFPDRRALDDLRAFLEEHLGDLLDEDAGSAAREAAIVRNIGADPLVHLCDFRPCAQARVFGNRSRVREMMGIDALGDHKGRGVNVVIVDQGLNEQEITSRHPAAWGGGLVPTTFTDRSTGRMISLPTPGAAPRTSHGMMIARNVLDIAPEAKLYDVPLIPLRIERPNVFAVRANAAFKAVLDTIERLRTRRGVAGAWVLVNAWAIFDRSSEHPPGDYTLNVGPLKTKRSTGKLPSASGHPLNRIMSVAAARGIDVVFGAGNCGQFSTDLRCGPFDRGEGHSIWGANAHDGVLTVGAVSANEQWLGYSSQGPAPWGDGPRQKPDVCTPSHFCEDRDPSRINSGTSAATGLAAGVIAAVRQEFAPERLSPAKLKAAINRSARGQAGKWNARTGHGLLDAAALLRRLSGVAEV